MENKKVKRTSKNNYTVFRSKEGTIPYNELTEEQRILEGTRQPFLIKPNFEKTAKEKKELAKRKRKSNGHFSGTSAKVELLRNPAKITVFLKNNRASNKSMDKANFCNTHTFLSRSPEYDSLMLALSMDTEVQSIVVNGKKI